MPKAPRTGFLVTLAGGLIASAACGCEAVLGLDWTPSDRAEERIGLGGGGGTTPDAGAGGTGGIGIGTPSTGGGGGAASGGDCDLAACPSPASACQVAGCVAFVCAIIASPLGTPCTEDGGAVCDGGGACVQCNTSVECSGPGATCADHVCESCDDDVPNGLETDTDCGGGVCPKCALGRACLVDTDCKGKASCEDGICMEDN